MEFVDAVRRRRMVRSYDPNRPVPRERLDALLQLAIRAPSAGFSQGWRFLVLDTPADCARFWQATSDGDPDSWLLRMSTAPALIVFFSDKDAYLDRYAEADKGWTDRDESRWPVPYWDVDVGMAAMITLLGVVDQGLAACWFGVPPDRMPALFEAFSVPSHLRAVGVMSVGHPANDRKSPSLKRGRRSLDSVVSYGSF
jgi:nitroreductase